MSNLALSHLYFRSSHKASPIPWQLNFLWLRDKLLSQSNLQSNIILFKRHTNDQKGRCQAENLPFALFVWENCDNCNKSYHTTIGCWLLLFLHSLGSPILPLHSRLVSLSLNPWGEVMSMRNPFTFCGDPVWGICVDSVYGLHTWYRSRCTRHCWRGIAVREGTFVTLD